MNLNFLDRAIELAGQSVQNGGGPFGAVIVKGGKIIAEASNSVTLDKDPSAHAEVNAIRKACRTLGSHDLSGADIYSSCEPCPMCLGAIYWARISHLYFAAGRKDAKDAGFDDDLIYRELEMPIGKRTLPTARIATPNALKPFSLWADKADKKEY